MSYNITMKKKIYLLLCLAAVFVTSCYNDEDIWDKLNSLEDRLNQIEMQLSKMNSEINTMSSIVNVLQGYVYVKEVTPTADGYIIKFSDGNTAVITNGKDGNDGKDGKDGKDAPIIGFEMDFDGVYYWTQTIDGVTTWLTDIYGNKVRATGADGKTPLLKVSTSGYWMISYDNGITYDYVLDAKGNMVKATGKDGQSGSSWFDKVTYDSTTGILTLVINGETIKLTVGANNTGIPSDNGAGTPPTVSDNDKTFEMPKSISAMTVDPSNPNVGTFSLAGINANGNWLELYGTNQTNQNVWIEINGINKGFTVTYGEQPGIVNKSKADIVFLVDNSGSMWEEADKVAAEIERWAGKLSQTMDVKFGCVGLSEYGNINGALNITDVQTMSEYLNQNSGLYRTQHFGQNMANPPADWSTLKSKTEEYYNPGYECGGIGLHFANENFTFRDGANRFYVYFTDEENQPGRVTGYPWSVKTVDINSQYYKWSSTSGVIYTVYSGLDLYGDPHGWTNWNYLEDPTLFSTYTGGIFLETTGDFNISLDDLPVTGAITQSFTFKFNITADLKKGGLYDITILIKSKDGKAVSKYTYEDIQLI